MNDVTSSLIFNGYVIMNIGFELNHNYSNNVTKFNMKSDFDLSFDIQCNNENMNGYVSLTAHIYKNAAERNLPFELNVTIVGNFGNKGIEPSEFSKYLELNGVTILFPFLRSTIADITRTANISALMIPAINVHTLIKDKEQNEVKK